MNLHESTYIRMCVQIFLVLNKYFMLILRHFMSFFYTCNKILFYFHYNGSRKQICRKLILHKFNLVKIWTLNFIHELNFQKDKCDSRRNQFIVPEDEHDPQEGKFKVQKPMAFNYVHKQRSETIFSFCWKFCAPVTDAKLTKRSRFFNPFVSKLQKRGWRLFGAQANRHQNTHNKHQASLIGSNVQILPF